MISPINNVISLKNRVGSEIVKKNLQNQEKDPARAEEMNRVLMMNWEAIKSISTTMWIKTTRIENQVIKQCQASGEPEDLQSNVNRLFRQLAQQCDAASTFGEIIPVSVSAYECLHKEWENKALLTLSCKIVPPLTAVTITQLDLSDCGLKVIPPEIHCCASLQALELSGNQISFVPDFQHLTQLQILYLNNNQISIVPDFDLPQLQTLKLSSNQISIIPDFQHLPKLRTFYLECTQISAVPDFQHLPLLDILYLTGNQISVVPDFQYLPNLGLLWLDHNQIFDVPDFQHLPLLDNLNLSYNSILSVTNFQHLFQLRLLQLNGNQISIVPDFKHLSQLQMLSMVNNQISIVPDFRHLSQLRRLDLSWNQISIVPDFHLPQLRMLTLENNQIFLIPDFQYMPMLDSLLISGNALLFFCKINPDYFMYLKKKDCCSKANQFRNYHCLSNLSRFVQLLALKNEDVPAIREAFSLLTKEDQDLILEMVYKSSPFASEDPQWIELHFLDNMKLFCRAVNKALLAKFNRISEEYRNKVDEQPALIDQISEEDHLYWGTPESFEHTLVLIDAMSHL